MQAFKRIEKVRKLLREQNLDAIIVRNTSDLMWLTGFDGVFDTEQAHVAIILHDSCILHTDSRYVTAMREHAQTEGIWQIDASRLREPKFVAQTLEDLKLKTGRIAIDTSMPLGTYRSYSDELPNARFKERSGDILKLRAVKDEDEIALMKSAQQIASQAFTDTLAHLQVGMTEREVSLELEFNMRKGGADELAFANIIASGPNSANPHAVPSARALEPGDLVVFDFGARSCGYRSDTTRTVSVGGPTVEQQYIYDTVRLANAEVAHAIKIGATGAQLQKLAEDVLAGKGYENRMGHSLGHGVGIDIHELPVLGLSNKEPLVAGNVVTDEPGIYLSGSNGVRIEDCGVVTETGFESFCELTHELQVIE
jgi:Xaa-Pro aminopeptidase